MPNIDSQRIALWAFLLPFRTTLHYNTRDVECQVKNTKCRNYYCFVTSITTIYCGNILIIKVEIWRNIAKYDEICAIICNYKPQYIVACINDINIELYKRCKELVCFLLLSCYIVSISLLHMDWSFDSVCLYLRLWGQDMLALWR